MAHIRAPEADLDLDDIWYYVAKQSGSIEIAERLIDSITDRFLSSFPLPVPRPFPRRGLAARSAKLSGWRVRDRLPHQGGGRRDPTRGTRQPEYRKPLCPLTGCLWRIES